MMTVITKNLRSVQMNGGIKWKFRTNHDYNVKLPILLVLGDAVGLDKLCGLWGGADNPQCRYCICPFYEMSNPDANYQLTQMANLKHNGFF